MDYTSNKLRDPMIATPQDLRDYAAGYGNPRERAQLLAAADAWDETIRDWYVDCLRLGDENVALRKRLEAAEAREPKQYEHLYFEVLAHYDDARKRLEEAEKDRDRLAAQLVVTAAGKIVGTYDCGCPVIEYHGRAMAFCPRHAAKEEIKLPRTDAGTPILPADDASPGKVYT